VTADPDRAPVWLLWFVAGAVVAGSWGLAALVVVGIARAH
jgi:hypothetical protein